jgi:hypothetical protein
VLLLPLGPLELSFSCWFVKGIMLFKGTFLTGLPDFVASAYHELGSLFELRENMIRYQPFRLNPIQEDNR